MTRPDYGFRVATTIRQLRTRQRMPYTELSALLGDLGRPIPVLGLRRLERGERKVDVDDLFAIAEALGVTAERLLGRTVEDVQRDAEHARAEWMAIPDGVPGSA